jgi:hypothetical protein
VILRKLIFVTISLLLNINASYALEAEEFRAKIVEVEDGVATLFSHESALFGLSCSSGPIGELENIKIIKLGDTIFLNNYEFMVGIINVTRFLEDASWGGTKIAKKGDVVCVLAADEAALPSDGDCDALWVRIPHCRPLQ